MAVHMFRVLIDRGGMPVADLESAINDWVSSNAEWEEDNVGHTLTELNTELDGSGETYYRMDVRFLLEDAKANLVQKFTDKLKEKVDWYRVGYHRCSHDESDPQPCDWQDRVEWTAKNVSIPRDIPSFEVA